MGLLQQDPEKWFKLGTKDIEGSEIELMIQQRNLARSEKDFVESDRIRDELAASGIELEDGPSGTTWKKS